MPRKKRSILEQQGKDTSRLFPLGILARLPRARLLAALS